MTAPYNTLYLKPGTWDLTLDSSGNIAMAAAPYALAQDAASAVRTFLGEVYYDTTQGVPYWEDIFGKNPPMSLLKADLVAAAMTVPGVTNAQVFISEIVNRQVQGQIQVTDTSGTVSAASF